MHEHVNISISYVWIKINASKPQLSIFVLRLSISFKLQIIAISAVVPTASLTLTTQHLPSSNYDLLASSELLCRSTTEYCSDLNLPKHNI